MVSSIMKALVLLSAISAANAYWLMGIGNHRPQFYIYDFINPSDQKTSSPPSVLTPSQALEQFPDMFIQVCSLVFTDISTHLRYSII